MFQKHFVRLMVIAPTCLILTAFFPFSFWGNHFVPPTSRTIERYRSMEVCSAIGCRQHADERYGDGTDFAEFVPDMPLEAPAVSAPEIEVSQIPKPVADRMIFGNPASRKTEEIYLVFLGVVSILTIGAATYFFLRQ